MEATARVAPAIDAVVDGIVRDGYGVVSNFLTGELVELLHTELRERQAAGEFRPAAIGQGLNRQVDAGERSDQIRWLEAPYSSAQQLYLDHMEQLRSALNASLFLGLFDFECHFSVYPPGARYRKHLDRFRQDSRRTVSCVAYLNPAWRPMDGGQLRLYDPTSPDNAIRDVEPAGGTLACFLSDRIPHEVLPATRERFSLTGWFRVRAA